MDKNSISVNTSAIIQLVIISNSNNKSSVIIKATYFIPSKTFSLLSVVIKSAQRNIMAKKTSYQVFRFVSILLIVNLFSLH